MSALLKTLARMKRKIRGSSAVKKTAAGFRQKTFWSKRNWWRTRATPLMGAPPPSPSACRVSSR